MRAYLDTSAAVKLLVAEPGTAELEDYLDQLDDHSDELLASRLLFTELHCAVARRDLPEPERADVILDSLLLVDVQRRDLDTAAVSGWRLRAADAIHLATALRVGATTMVTYDAELASAATRAGLRVVSPGP